MPKLSVWFIRSSLLYLATGFTLGAMLLMNKAVPFFPTAWDFLPVHIECVVIGFILQLTLGTAFWIFPRLVTLTDRGNESLIYLSFGLVNLGILTVCFFTFTSSDFVVWGRILETSGVVCFVLQLWPRVYPFGKY
jgi:hypothetical protein